MLHRLLARSPFDSFELIILTALPCALLVALFTASGGSLVSAELQNDLIKFYSFALLIYFGAYIHTGSPRGEAVRQYEGSWLHLPLWIVLVLALLTEALFVLILIDLVLPNDGGAWIRGVVGLERCGSAALCRIPVLSTVSIMAVCYWGIPALGGVGWRYLVRTSAKERRFRAVCYGLLGHLARADGRVQEAEALILNKFCQEGLGLDQSRAAQVVEAIKGRPIGSFEEHLQRCVAQNPPFLRDFILELLFILAAADKYVGPEEEELLIEAAYVLVGDPDRIEALFITHVQRRPPLGAGRRRRRARATNSDTGSRRAETQQTARYEHSPYTVLGVKPDDSLDVIKRRYRMLVKKLHPDVLQGQGVPAEMIEQATRRFHRVQAAYEDVVRLRGG